MKFQSQMLILILIKIWKFCFFFLLFYTTYSSKNVLLHFRLFVFLFTSLKEIITKNISQQCTFPIHHVVPICVQH